MAEVLLPRATETRVGIPLTIWMGEGEVGR